MNLGTLKEVIAQAIAAMGRTYGPQFNRRTSNGVIWARPRTATISRLEGLEPLPH